MRRSRVRSKRRKSSGGILKFLLFLLIIGAGVFAYFSPQFEKVPPKIVASNKVYVNAQSPLKFTLSDNGGIQSAKVTLVANGKEIPIYAQNFLLKTKRKDIEVKLPQEVINLRIKKWDIVIEVRDSSKWNFLRGNKAIFHGKLYIDTTPPIISIVAKSYSILKGGSALVIYKVKDESLKETYIDVGDGTQFKAIKYKKEGVYATLIAWPFNKESFNPIIVAIDTSGNVAKMPFELYRRNKKYRVSKIRASDRFINGKISELASQDPEYANITDKFQKFRAVNEFMRKKNEEYIHSHSKKVTPFNGSWDIHVFYPLKGAKKISDFGAKRFYYYGSPNNIISTSYHVGYDFASVKHANIYTSNDGRVVSTKLNGIYGNMPLIDHGFGLYTLYGHCSTILVKEGQKVKSGDVIAKTGKTGLALGDHLHFGILVQGVEVYPLEWMSKKWLKDNIIDIFKKADTKLGYN